MGFISRLLGLEKKKAVSNFDRMKEYQGRFSPSHVAHIDRFYGNDKKVSKPEQSRRSEETSYTPSRSDTGSDILDTIITMEVLSSVMDSSSSSCDSGSYDSGSSDCGSCGDSGGGSCGGD